MSEENTTQPQEDAANTGEEAVEAQQPAPDTPDTSDMPTAQDGEALDGAAQAAETSEDKDAFKFVEDPVFNIEYKGDCMYEVGVTIPTANLVNRAGQLFDELQSEAEMPGFRRGRAPRKLLERKFGKHVLAQVQEGAVGAAFEKLVKDADLHPIGGLDIDGLDEDKDNAPSLDKPLEFTLKFDVAPRAELGAYRGLKVERPILDVADEDIDAAVKEVQGQFTVFEAVPDAQAQEGDQVVIDFVGTVDGVEFQGGKADNYPYVLGSKRFFGEFEEVLKGAKAGDERTCQVAFPEDHINERLRGQTADFVIKVNEIKRRTAPEVTDEFAVQAGFEDAAQMRTQLRQRLQNEMKQQSDQIAQNRLLDQILAASSFEIAPSFIDRAAKSAYEDEVDRLRQLRTPQGEIAEKEEQLQAQARKRGERQIKVMVALQEIARAEGLTVTEADFEREAAAMSRQLGVDADMIAQYLMSNEDSMSMYEHRILRGKVFDLLLETAEIADKPMTREELAQQAQQAQQATEGD